MLLPSLVLSHDGRRTTMTERRSETVSNWRLFATRLAPNKTKTGTHAESASLGPWGTGKPVQAQQPPAQQYLSADVPFLNEAPKPVFEAYVDRPNLLPAYWLELGVARARAVCKLYVAGTNWRGASSTWSGTGFLVSDHILLTNHHVLNNPDSARQAMAIFNYEDRPDGSTAPVREYHLNPERLFFTCPVAAQGDLPGLDFTFVWVDGEPGHDFGYIPLLQNQVTITTNEFANIIQHPGGRSKAIAIQENTVVSVTDNTIRYTTDTEPGSSGACVLDNNWIPIALHHASAPQADAPSQYVNEGITLAAIANRLEHVSSDDSQHSVAKELLSLFRIVV
jgi:V8-like Glu-specific endopeptidase